MKDKYELRIIRTYKLLTNAFVDIMKEKHFEDITVNELCEIAMIRRTTFYKHFADKYDFFCFFIRQLQSDFESLNNNLVDHQNPQFLMNIFYSIMSFLKENEQFVHMILNSRVFPNLLNILHEQIIFDIKEKIKIGIKEGIYISINPEIIASFFTGAITNTIIGWFVDKNYVSEEKLIQDVEKIIFALNGLLVKKIES